MAGLPATGKTRLATSLARRLDAVLVQVDAIERAIVGAGIWRNEATRTASYASTVAVARANLSNGLSVVIDAINSRTETRALWTDLADELHVDHAFVVTTCSDRAEHERRIKSAHAGVDGQPLTWDQLIELNMKTAFWGDEPRVTIDTAKPVDIDQIVASVQDCATHESAAPVTAPRHTPRRAQV